MSSAWKTVLGTVSGGDCTLGRIDLEDTKHAGVMCRVRRDLFVPFHLNAIDKAHRCIAEVW